MSRIVVTGAAGRLGSALVAAMRADGHRVLGIDRLPAKGDADHLTADLSEAGRLDGVFRADDILVHCASYAPPLAAATAVSTDTDELYLSLNIAGTWRVLAAAATAGVRRVVLTSSGAAGLLPAGLAPMGSEPAAQPRGPYSISKWFQEGAVQSFAGTHGIAAIILRPALFIAMDPVKLGYQLAAGVLVLEDVVAAHRDAVTSMLARGATARPGRVEVLNVGNALPYVVDDEPLLAAEGTLGLMERYWPGSADWFRARGLDTSDTVPVVVQDIAPTRATIGWAPRMTFDAWWTRNRDIAPGAAPSTAIGD